MRLIRPVLRLGGWLVVVIAAIVGLIAFFAAGNANATAAAIAWVVAFVAFGASGGVYWLLRRTGGDEPEFSYEPLSVLEELAVPVLTKINEGSRPFTRGGIGIITLGAWLVAVVMLATVWVVVAILVGLVLFLGSRAFAAVGIEVPDPVVVLAALSALIVPIAAAIRVLQWARRRPAIRYWLR